MVEHDHRALFDVETSERAVQLVAIDQAGKRVWASSLVDDRVDLDETSTPLASRLAIAAPDEDTV